MRSRTRRGRCRGPIYLALGVTTVLYMLIQFVAHGVLGDGAGAVEHDAARDARARSSWATSAGT